MTFVPTEWQLARMRPEDLDQVMEIEAYSFPTPWKRAMYESDIVRNERSRFYVIRHPESGEVAGYIGTWFVYDEAHIGTIAVKDSFRGLRLAEQLIAYTALHAMNEQMAYIILEVRVNNDAAIRLYTRMGFEQVGLRKGYYSDTGEDAILMTCDKLAELASRLTFAEDQA